MPTSRGSADRDGRTSPGGLSSRARLSRRGLPYHSSGYAVLLLRGEPPRSSGCGPVSGRASWALVPGHAAGPARRPVAGSAEVPRRSAVPVVAVPVVAGPVVAGPVVAGREHGVAVRGLRALVGRVGVSRVAVAEV